jgi:hypothetical protein
MRKEAGIIYQRENSKFQYQNVFKLYVCPYFTVIACMMLYLNGIQANSTASTSRNTTSCN